MTTRYSDLGNRMAKGALWSVLRRLAVRSVGAISVVVLARLLAPSDFGLVVLANMLVAFVELFSQLEIGTFLIRKQESDRSYYDTGWTLLLMRGGLTAVLLTASAPFVADFFAEPRLQNVVYALAGVSLIDGLANIGIIDFQKSLNFDRDFRLMVWTRLVSFAATVSFAVMLRNYWALVIGTLAGSCATSLFSYTMHPYRPRFSLVRTGAILKFSKWMLANNLLYYAQRRSYAFVMGKILDSASLGVYSLAREVSALATSELVAPIRRVLLPGLATLGHEPHAMRRAFLDGLSMIVMLALPLSVGIALVADPLVRVAMGPKWLEAIPLVQILAAVGVARVCTSNSDPHLLALNLPHLTSVLACFGAVVGVLSMLWAASNWGLVGAAWATGVTAVLQMLLNYAIIWRVAAISPAAVGAVVWRSVASCLAMSGAVLALLNQWPRTDTTFALLGQLSCACVLGAVVYVVAHLALWRICGEPAGAEKHALQMATGVAARFRSRRVSDRG